jgi:hypothetical protein
MILSRIRGFRKAGQYSFVFVLGTLFLFSMMTMPTATAASSSFQEDFTTTSYRDGSNSNVSGWGTGMIELQREPLNGSMC